MLKELSQIARGMMFLHGHFTRPEDLAEKQAPATAAAQKVPVKVPAPAAWLPGWRVAKRSCLPR